MNGDWKKFANAAGKIQHRYFVNDIHKASVWLE